MTRPNVIILLMDTVRAKNLPLYGYERDTTPHLQRFCEKANLFELSYSPGIWTIPAHASLFTGLFPTTHGALNLHRYLDGTHPTLAEILAAAGYATALFSNNLFVSSGHFGLSRGFQTIQGPNFTTKKLQRAALKTWKTITKSRDLGAAATNMLARDWLSRVKRTGSPFFLFVNYMEAHAPYKHLPWKFLRRNLSNKQISRIGLVNQDRQGYLTRTVDMTEEDFIILRLLYDTMISYLDSKIGDFISFFKSLGIYDNSLILITSDHGDMIGEHLLIHHSYCVYEELIRIPLIIKLPGSQDNGNTFSCFASLIDLVPTILGIISSQYHQYGGNLPGLQLFDNCGVQSRECVFSECEKPKNEFADTYPDFDFSAFDNQLLAVRNGRYKFIWSSNSQHELYDLEKDPEELNNLVNDMPKKAANLQDSLWKWYSALPRASNSEEQPVEAESAIKEQLRALGYY